MERIDRLRKLSSNKKHQTSSNFQKLMTHSTSYSLLMEKNALNTERMHVNPVASEMVATYQLVATYVFHQRY